MKLGKTKYGFLPTYEQELLILAATQALPKAKESWDEWKSLVKIEEHDPASFRLLPYVASNLKNQDIKEDRTWTRIKGVYKQNWVRNQRLIKMASNVSSGLKNLGVEVLLLKGASLLAQGVVEAGARVMADLDILVQSADVATAMRALNYLGWRPAFPTFAIDPYAIETKNFIEVRHSADYKRRGFPGIDLHWRMLQAYYLVGAKTQNCTGHEMWEGSFEVEFGSLQNEVVRVKVASPAVQLFHTCVHGTRWHEHGSVYWAVDAMKILSVYEKELDWDQFLRLARANYVALPLKTTLSYLVLRLGAKIPSRVLAEIEAISISLTDRILFDMTSRFPPWGIGFYAQCWRWPGGVLDYIYRYWGLENRWQSLRYRRYHEILHVKEGPRKKRFESPDQKNKLISKRDTSQQSGSSRAV